MTCRDRDPDHPRDKDDNMARTTTAARDTDAVGTRIDIRRAGQPFPTEARRGTLLPVVSNGSIQGTLAIHQDATMLVGSLAAGETVVHRPTVGERTHLYVVSGRVRLGEETLDTGDAARITGRGELTIAAEQPA